MKTLFAAILGSTALLATAPAMAGTSAKADIVETAISADGFDTLVAAVKAAGLVETLKGDGPFTVFAPTDEAFAALPEGKLDELLKPENKDQLAAVLSYHVVPGEMMAEDLSGKVKELATVHGDTVDINATDGVLVDEATVISADVTASNGVIHVIDKVILPDS